MAAARDSDTRRATMRTQSVHSASQSPQGTTAHRNGNTVTASIERTALSEIMVENLWSWDKLAFEIGIEASALRGWINGWSGDTPAQRIQLRNAGVRITRFLDEYIDAPKPVPEKKHQKRGYDNSRWLPTLRAATKVR